MGGLEGGARGRWPRGAVTAAVAVVAAGLLPGHARLPRLPGNAMSLLETFLPWLGLVALAGFVVAAVRRSVVAVVASALLLGVWAWTFRSVLPPSPGGGPHDLTVVQHNVSDENADPSRAVRILLGASPDLVALEELTPERLPAYRAALAPTHPHHATVGSVGLWSRYPLRDSGRVDIKPRAVGDGWERGLRVVVTGPRGDLTAYVVHLPSVRVRATQGYATGWRDESARRLGDAIAAEPANGRILVVGDLNGTIDDRGLRPVTSVVGAGRDSFAFSWPARLPLARIDHVLTRGAVVTRTWTLPGTGSDHLPIAAHVRF
ncbi:endonuclease/exonuclease/phosphatase family protein [Streptomyces sp. NPDC048338]|uniref:endonuclease/exonuclease/phosphatase family protein n=1 Tax=Streptomyces sp. NPDC048338 TaxID=3365536 RepID=UPI0037178A41